ncbi:FAD:protein FMN transferase, partial [Candidatus Woesearchaeota archaeon]|nr:FAD:protein FMN transferase [Candidatus Woesearchaeota archaeon]
MGSPCELQLYAANRNRIDTAMAAVRRDVSRLESRYSRYRPDSDLSRINAVARTGGSLEVDAETRYLLDYAETCYRQSDGLFDITSGVLREAWRFESGALPDQTLIDTLLEKVGWNKLRWEAPRLTFPVPGMALDLGGIVKEYAADRAATLCRDHGVSHGLINLGGDVRIVGPHPDGQPWRLGIQHPRQPEALIHTLALRQGGLASSGDYARCLVIDGVRYGHILNPRTGWPVQELAAVSVWAGLCVVAGSASTIAMLKGKAGINWLETLGLPCFWVDVTGETGFSG